MNSYGSQTWGYEYICTSLKVFLHGIPAIIPESASSPRPRLSRAYYSLAAVDAKGGVPHEEGAEDCDCKQEEDGGQLHHHGVHRLKGGIARTVGRER